MLRRIFFAAAVCAVGCAASAVAQVADSDLNPLDRAVMSRIRKQIGERDGILARKSHRPKIRTDIAAMYDGMIESNFRENVWIVSRYCAEPVPGLGASHVSEKMCPMFQAWRKRQSWPGNLAR